MNDACLDGAVGGQLQPTVRRRDIVQTEIVASWGELHTGRRTSEQPHAVCFAGLVLVNVPPEDSSYLRVALKNLPEFGSVL